MTGRFLHRDVMNFLLLLESVRTSCEAISLLMFSSIVNFSMEFFLRICFSLLISSLDWVAIKTSTWRKYILGYCIVFNILFSMWDMKMDIKGLTWVPMEIRSICVYIFPKGSENMGRTGIEKIFDYIWFHGRKRNEGVIIFVSYYNSNCFLNVYVGENKHPRKYK